MAAKPKQTALTAVAPDIAPHIAELRGQRVILDADLASIYGVPTKALNQAVRRNAEKFPADFMFRLSKTEAEEVRRSRSQFVTLKRGENIKYLPNAFTEHGAIMAATVLNSPRAVQMSVFVVCAFVKMRAALMDTRELARKLAVASRPSRPSGLLGPFCLTEAPAAPAAAPSGNRLPRQRRRRALPPQAETCPVWGWARRRGVNAWPTLENLKSQIVISSWGGQHPLRQTHRLEKAIKTNLPARRSRPCEGGRGP